MSTESSEPNALAEIDRKPKNATVVILHGIWMHGLFMQVLAKRLRQYGYQTRCISYPFLSQTPTQNAQRLAKIVASIDTPVVHFAAHSLGGVVWLHYINSGAKLPPGRTVLLGSPVKGSHVAARLYRRALGRKLLGKSVEKGLLGGAPTQTYDHEVGLIRGGTYPFSIWVRKGATPSDGVVLHTETELPAVEHVSYVKWSHSTLIFSASTAAQAASFFDLGRFSNTG